MAFDTRTPVLPAALRLGAAHLVVTDLDRSVAWYQRALGLRVGAQDVDRVALGSGDGTDVLVLHEDAAARRPGRHAGLYHVALLFPTREELARATVRLAATRTPISGASDHGTHEALYLPDPDGNGLELAADRPRERWGDYDEFDRGGPRPLDTDALLATVADEAPADQVRPGLRVGHVHLHVGDVDRGLAFYRDVVGFELWARLSSAAFVSAGGYHHHLAFNVWRGEGVPAAPADGVVGLREWTVELPTAGDLGEVRGRLEAAQVPVDHAGPGLLARDPWGIAVRLVSRG